MACKELVVRIAGEAGEGVISTGELITRAAARAGFHLATYKIYPAEVKGGHSVFQLRISSSQVLTPGDEIGLLVAMNPESFRRHESDLASVSTVVYDSSVYQPDNTAADTAAVGIPFQALAREELQFELGKNMIAVGALASLMALPLEDITARVAAKFQKKGERIVQKNLAALELGAAYVQQTFLDLDSLRLTPPESKEPLMIATGNEAIALGAMTYGVKHFYGYPITPASEIMEFMALHLPKVGGLMLQAEDEIASLAMAIGASFSGVPTMTATSGPGLSLMSEALGLAAIAETPVVIVDVQRAGPSTGMPTKTEQSDLYLASFGGHGDLPRVVIAPLSIPECFEQVIVAFNIAESLQLPVIVLSDQSMAMRAETITRPEISQVTRSQRLLWDGKSTPYERFRLTQDGVSPMAIPGMPGGQHVVSGLEQSEDGRPRYDGETHAAMTKKRFAKLSKVSELVETTKRFGDKDSDIGILTWGSSAGPALEAVSLLQLKGLNVAGMALRLLSPFPMDEVLTFVNGCKTVLIAEVNFQGQLASLIEGRQEQGTTIRKFTSIEGVPFRTGELVAALEEVALK